ncbi:MAG: hypothetical protein EHM88_12290, partial [Candidatus Rokuibacteriota bacterium]
MAAAGLLLAPRVRPRGGPALRTAPLPVTATVLSAAFHGALVLIMILAATVWSTSQPKTYVVNLVPAVAAVGTPQGRTVTPTPRPPDPPPRVTERPAELPERPTPRAQAPAPPPDLPARAPELPARAPELPARTAALPDRPSL